MHLISLLRHRLRADQGFAMVTVMAVMLVGSIVAVAAVTASDRDRPVSVRDKERKQAFAAAEAGVNDYLARLVSNVDYWRKCGSDPNNASLNPRITSPGDTRKWAPIANTRASYSVEVLPANGTAQCLASDPMGTYIDSTTGTFRIRSTGRIDGDAGDKRSIVATFKRRGFLDYVYFTDYETNSPKWFTRWSRGQNTRQNIATGSRTIETWADAECVKYYRDGGQRATYTNGEWNNGGAWTPMSPAAQCGPIQFVTGDQQRGPFHTNDEILVCGTPQFGRRPGDDIEISAPDGAPGGVGDPRGYRTCGSGAPQVNQPGATTPDPNLGTLRIGSPKVEMPPSNTSLKSQALPKHRFVGTARIRMEGTVIRALATLRREDGSTVAANSTIPLPVNGVIWVANSTTAPCSEYDPVDVVVDPDCGDLWISGDYDHSLTLSAENDVVINGNVTRDDADDVLLGLIADKWIRVAHPVTSSNPNQFGTTGCVTNGSGLGNVEIEAAILAVRHSFTVDRYWCGPPRMGTLTVRGAIAQKFRGPVGTSGDTGYIKNYFYDDRLRFRTPPHFLDPVQASWKVQTQVEQVPAT